VWCTGVGFFAGFGSTIAPSLIVIISGLGVKEA
jgi:hypothetical protein